MLIQTGQTTGFKDVRKWKNPYWERQNKTPNEAFKEESQYRDCVRSFKQMHAVSAPNRFYEVRVVKQEPSFLLLKASKQWWDTPGLMDHVFWVFQQPLYVNAETTPYGFYVLEPMECQRVCELLCARHGLNVPEYPGCFIIPTENCVMAWSETANGVSEHIHYRPEEVLTQAEIDKQEATQEAVTKLLEEAANSPKLMEQFNRIK